MKKILYILLLTPIIYLASCSKSSNIDVNSDTLLGIWSFDYALDTYTYGYIDPVLGTEIVTSSIDTVWNTLVPYLEYYRVYRYDDTLSHYGTCANGETYGLSQNYYTFSDDIITSRYPDGGTYSEEVTRLTVNNLTSVWSSYSSNQNTAIDTIFFVYNYVYTHFDKIDNLPQVSDGFCFKGKNYSLFE